MDILYIELDGGSPWGVSELLLGLRPKHKFGTVCLAAIKKNILTCYWAQRKGWDDERSGLLLDTQRLGSWSRQMWFFNVSEG